MRKFKFNNEEIIEELQHASPVKTGKHFQSFFVDCFLLILVSYLLFLGANSIATNTKSYEEASFTVKEEIKYYNDYVAKSRAMEYEIIDGEQVRKDYITDQSTGISKIIAENINRAIYYSYVHYGDFYNQYGIAISENNLNLIKLSVSDKGQAYDDNISYFYTEYLLNTNDNYSVKFSSLLEAQQYVQTIYKEAFGDDATELFVFDLNQSPVPILKTEAAFYLYYNLYVAEDTELTEKSEDYYYIFDTTYTSMLSAAERIMITGEPYYSTHYANYYNNNAVIGRITNIALIISIFIGYLICILLPKIIFKHGRTIGRILFKLGEITVYNDPITWKEVLFKSIFGFLGYLSIIFIMYMFKPFYGVFDAMFMPFIGELPLILFVGIIMILSLINGIVMLFTHDKVGIDGLISRTILVDRKYLDDLNLKLE